MTIKNNKFTPKEKIISQKQNKTIYRETKEIVKRLFTQTTRRPSTLLINVIQPILWLFMFGALFQNAPIYLFEEYKLEYKGFLNSGILVFTAFSNSINAGLTIIFDREFGFLNRILISPIKNKNSLIYACLLHTWVITTIQILCIGGINLIVKQDIANIILELKNTITTLLVISTIIITIANISIYSAFILPGHIEFIGLTTLFSNLPTLFTSTALAPLSFMPNWLQFICCINPLTYAIEIIRQTTLCELFTFEQNIIQTEWIAISKQQSLIILIFITLTSFTLVQNIIKYKYDKT
uniref:ABC transmembrane type-2 domain-containing protein n=1 Tax=Polysiphonia sertularioides TaxID=945028 RepID=A0A1Z1M9V6_9FLOR|nr:hypothetical protein [Polysiphonia sertularioides]ARW62555.1 hypothetical protein [Polysiphonia sertularioides]